jgi:hypothetical protein
MQIAREIRFICRQSTHERGTGHRSTWLQDITIITIITPTVKEEARKEGEGWVVKAMSWKALLGGAAGRVEPVGRPSSAWLPIR